MEFILRLVLIYAREFLSVLGEMTKHKIIKSLCHSGHLKSIVSIFLHFISFSFVFKNFLITSLKSVKILSSQFYTQTHTNVT